MQAWATILIAAIAAMIAYFQWVTAHQRMVLDLFDRRMNVFSSLECLVFETIRDGQVPRKQWLIFRDALAAARFLFGDDVHQELAALQTHIAFLSGFSEDDSEEGWSQTEEAVTKRDASLKALQGWDARLERAFLPYMKLDQKQRKMWWPF